MTQVAFRYDALRRSRNLRGRLIVAVRTLWKNKNALIGLIIVAAYLITALVVTLGNLLNIHVEPYDPIKQYPLNALSGPSWVPYLFSSNPLSCLSHLSVCTAHLMGTDQLGRDVFSRVLAATPNDVGIGLAVVGSAILIGTLVGAGAAFRGGRLEEVMMRATDIFFGLPALVLAMSIAIAIGKGLVDMMFVLMIIWWPVYARISRGETLKISHQNYIEAATISGSRKIRTLFKHIIPNIAPIILVYATLDVGGVVLAYAGLSYLGLSVTPPFPDWGQMVNEYQDYMVSYPYLSFFPGLIISLAIIGWSLLGDGLRDALSIK